MLSTNFPSFATRISNARTSVKFAKGTTDTLSEPDPNEIIVIIKEGFKPKDTSYEPIISTDTHGVCYAKGSTYATFTRLGKERDSADPASKNAKNEAYSQFYSQTWNIYTQEAKRLREAEASDPMRLSPQMGAAIDSFVRQVIEGKER